MEILLILPLLPVLYLAYLLGTMPVDRLAVSSSATHEWMLREMRRVRANGARIREILMDLERRDRLAAQEPFDRWADDGGAVS